MRSLPLLLALILSAAQLSAESAGGLRWTMPNGWRAQPERPMRAATYTIAAAPGDREPGECAVFFFGRGQGGSVQDNLDRVTSEQWFTGGVLVRTITSTYNAASQLSLIRVRHRTPHVLDTFTFLLRSSSLVGSPEVLTVPPGTCRNRAKGGQELSAAASRRHR